MDTTIPLLIEGKAPITGVAGAIVTQNDVVQSNRGTLKEIMPLVRQYRVPTVPGQVGNGYRVTMSIGGQDIIKNEPVDKWTSLADFGTEREQRLLVTANQAQTVRTAMDGADFVGPDNTDLVPLLFYTSREREEWLSKFDWSQANRFKRETFTLAVGPGVFANTFNLRGIIPRNNGPVVGYSIFVNANQDDVTFAQTTVRINGVVTSLNVPCSYNGNFSQRVPYIWKYPFQAGSEFELDYTLFAPISSGRIRVYLTFYFNG